MAVNGARGTPRIVIVGAGFGGVGLAIRLRMAGIESFTLVERADGVGGVWRDNSYPGAACDVPSHLYSFSFEPKHDWSRRYPPRDEILAYIEACARKHGIDERIRFGTEVVSADWDEETRTWRVELSDGERLEADVLVAATGQLSRPAFPRIPGLDAFAGTIFHSARWDHGFDPRGKRVAVIGTGASAIQFIPHLAREAAALHVFQRSAPWVIPKRDPVRRGWMQRLYRRLPVLQAANRELEYIGLETRSLGFTRYPWIMRLFEALIRREIRRKVADPVLRKKLTPDYPLGCKRVLIATDWYEVVQRANVELVTDPVAEVGEGAVVTADGRERPVDAIVLGTGFRASEFLAPMRIRGRNGVELDEAWRGGAEAYLGLAVSGFPNLFVLYGPNTNLGGNSILHMLESQFAYVLAAVRELGRPDVAALEVRPEVQRKFNEELQERLAGSVWQAGCSSWYLDAHGRNTNNWPGTTIEYRRRTRDIDLGSYALVPADG